MHHHHAALLTSSAPAGEDDTAARLPAAVGAWSRATPARRVDGTGLFDYMDGAGELYLAYRFRHLDVLEYRATPGEGIAVELYAMADPDDAFGLLSTDWSGEPVALGPAPAAASWPAALYGAGLLRLRAGAVYARVMALRESPTSREAVLALGRAIAAGAAPAQAPGLAGVLPAEVGGLALRRDSVCFLRSHLVLNATYFLAQRDILELGHDVEGLTARYDRGAAGVRVQLVLVRYPDPQRARGALARFRQAYLPETQRGQGIGELTLHRVEDGWAGVEVEGRGLALALGCPDAEAAVTFVAAGLQTLHDTGGRHD